MSIPTFSYRDNSSSFHCTSVLGVKRVSFQGPSTRWVIRRSRGNSPALRRTASRLCCRCPLKGPNATRRSRQPSQLSPELIQTRGLLDVVVWQFHIDGDALHLISV